MQYVRWKNGVFPSRWKSGVFPSEMARWKNGVFPSRWKNGVFPSRWKNGVFPSRSHFGPPKSEGPNFGLQEGQIWPRKSRKKILLKGTRPKMTGSPERACFWASFCTTIFGAFGAKYSPNKKKPDLVEIAPHQPAVPNNGRLSYRTNLM